MSYSAPKPRRHKHHSSYGRPSSGTGLRLSTNPSVVPTGHPSNLTRSVLITKSHLSTGAPTITMARTGASTGLSSHPSARSTGMSSHYHSTIDPRTGMPSRSHSHASTGPMMTVSRHHHHHHHH